MLWKLVLFAILKNVWRVFLKDIQNAESVILKGFCKDTIKIKIRFCNIAEINVQFLKIWIIE